MTFTQHHSTAQLDDHPRRRYYSGGNLDRVQSIEDLRARTHRLMPRLVLEYLEGGSGEEATLARERAAFADWRFVPHTLVDEHDRSVARDILGREAAMPLLIAPTGLNGIMRRHADIALAQGAASAGVPFVQSTMSNERMEDVAKVKGLRHWWQLYVFGGNEIWQSLVDRAHDAGCEALVLTTNSQIFGQREWYARTRMNQTMPSVPTVLNAAAHPRWIATTLNRGMPDFANVIDYIPKDKRGFFQSAFWIRSQMPKTLSWDHVARIRDRWKRPFFLKGLLHPHDIRRAMESGVDGVILGSHGGRQGDWTVSALDMLPTAREIVGDSMALYMSGGIRRGTDILKAVALGADAVLAGRAPLYGLCAAGADGVAKALDLLRAEMMNELGQMGAKSMDSLNPDILVRARDLPLQLPKSAVGGQG
ncbi:alpha-hydroxy acid oxidase [Stakelama flava]|nr:alpha-hydroxy acid oxidase [Stakelama flava]